jgi:hypothetical protein
MEVGVPLVGTRYIQQATTRDCPYKETGVETVQLKIDEAKASQMCYFCYLFDNY